MFDINTPVQWRTGGRGVFRTVKGRVVGIVKRGKLPAKMMQNKVPHGTKISNRDRYIVEIKGGTLAWANLKTCWKQGQKLPPATHRFDVKAKPAGKVKNARLEARRKMTPKQKEQAARKTIKAPRSTSKPSPKSKVETEAVIKTERSYVVADKAIKPLDRTSVAKKSGGDKPKTMWYGIVDGKVVSVRKVLCPEGFSKDKPAAPQSAPEAPTPEAPVEAAGSPVEAQSSALPSA